MKQFFKIVFASMLGAILSTFVLFFLFVIILFGIVANANKDTTTELKDNSILHIEFNYAITERSLNDPFKNFDLFNLENNSQPGLNDILSNIKKAKTDSHIKGIYLDLSEIQAGLSTIEEIRTALIDFKSSSKFIIAYSEIYSQKAYYLASVADKIYLNPAGIMELRGFRSNVMFFKGALDKLEIEPEIIRVGSFKSAVEPYFLEKMSDSSRLQTTELLNTIYNHFTEQLAIARSKKQEEIKAISNELQVRSAKDALELKMVDGLKYKDEILEELKKLSNKSKLEFISMKNYIHASPVNISTSKNKIAIIYANGEIYGGTGDDETIGSERISEAIRTARLDDNVKAVVLRINSPGGSALASDVIWREVVLCKKVKPVIASMGDVAASGGYYIACAADAIVAQPNTITGSIGVFGVLFNAQAFFRNKLGLTFDVVKTSEYADLGDVTRPLTESERNIIQYEVNHIYDDFTRKVAEGRKMKIEKVLSIAGGRVWSGTSAKELGLVDSLGNINDAILLAAKKAKLKDYRISSLPVQQDPIAKLLNNLSAETKTYFMKQQYGESYKYILELERIKNQNGIQARLPMNPIIE